MLSFKELAKAIKLMNTLLDDDLTNFSLSVTPEILEADRKNHRLQSDETNSELLNLAEEIIKHGE